MKDRHKLPRDNTALVQRNTQLHGNAIKPELYLTVGPMGDNSLSRVWKISH